MTPRRYGQNCRFYRSPLSDNSQKRLEHKEKQTKYRKMTRKPRIHVRILTYRTSAILPVKQSCHDKKLYIEKQETEDRSHSCDILGTAYFQLLGNQIIA